MKYVNFLLATTLLLVYSGCGNNSDLSTNPQIEEGGVIYLISLPKKEFSRADTLQFTFIITNTNSIEKDYTFGSSCHVGFKLVDNLKTAMSWPNICAAVVTGISVKPGETKKIEVNSTFTNFDGKLISPRTYLLQAFLLNNNSPVLSSVINVK